MKHRALTRWSVLVVLLFVVFVTPLAAAYARPAAQSTVTATPTTIVTIRTGPSTEFNRAGGALPGANFTVVGRNRQASWLQVTYQDGARTGWVAAWLCRVEGDLQQVPVTDGTADPTATPEETGATQPADQPAATMPAAGSDSVQATTTANLSLREGPGSDYVLLTVAPENTTITALARHNAKPWVVTNYDGQRGWMYIGYLDFEQSYRQLKRITSLEDLADDPAPPLAATSEPAASPSPSLSAGLASQYQTLMSAPPLMNTNTPSVHQIYQRGQSLGNRANVFTTAGDSLTVNQPSLRGYGQDRYNLGDYAHLQTTIDYFTASPVAGTPNSWVHDSWTAGSGFSSGMIVNELWINPAQCPAGPTLLDCELTRSRPSVVIILYGAQEHALNSTQPMSMFVQNMEEIVTRSIDNGVIPVLTTFAGSPDGPYWETVIRYNTVILQLAQQYNIPLINLFRVTQSLPGYGVHIDYYHLSQFETPWAREAVSAWEIPDDPYYSFTGGEALFGITQRNLLTLQMLDALRQNVLQ